MTVRPYGELDIATAPRLQGELERLNVEEGGVELMVLDLRNLVFLDSTGLEVIVQLDAGAPQYGYEVAVVRGPRAVERLFSVMQLHRKLRIIDDPAEL